MAALDQPASACYSSVTALKSPSILILAIFASAVAGPVWGQAGQAGAFLRQDATARSAALGGAMTALADDSSALTENPAGLAKLVKPEVGATHIVLFEDTSFDFVTGGLSSARWGGFAFGYLRQASGGFEARLGPNDSPTSFSVNQTGLLGGWGRSFSVPGLSASWLTRPKPLSVGVTVKSVSESIGATTASGHGADAGVLFQPDDNFSLGLSVSNLVAPKLTYVSQAISYPRVVDVSPAYLWKLSPDVRALTTFKVSKTDGESALFSAGVELQYLRLLAVRLGLRDKNLTTGIGVRFGNTSFDYAAQLGDLGVGNFFTFTQRFGQTPEELEETIRSGIRKLSYGEGARLSRAYQSKADEELGHDRIQEALRDLEAASLLDPSNGEIRAKINEVTARWDATLKRQMVERSAALAREQDRAGNLLAARQYWRGVLELEPSYSEASNALVRIDRDLSVEERTRLEGLRQAQSASEIALALAQASTFLSRGQLRASMAEAEKALKRFPGNAQVTSFIDQVRQQTRELVKTKLAEADAFAAAGNSADAMRSIESALREAPDDAALIQKAAALRAQVQKGITPEKRKEFEQLYYRAVEQYLKGGYKTADGLTDELLKIDPSSEAARTLKEKIGAALRYTQ
jgi:tetratricopeptide (TPR) repeat protein